jgi:hypothetical protein
LCVCLQGVVLTCGDSILCSDYAIRRVNEPFVKAGEDTGEWAL